MAQAPDKALVLKARSLNKAFQKDASQPLLQILSDIDLELYANESVAVIGKSGSGKSTLLHLLGGLLPLDSGSIEWVINQQNHPIHQMQEDEIGKLRSRYMGFVFQFHHLLPEFNALENVVIPQLIAGVSKKRAQEKAEHLLSRLGLAERLSHQPNELSGGEQQRVSIARALANDPALILADEPSGNLDEYHAKEMLDLLDEVQSNFYVSMLIATHDQSIQGYCKRVYTLEKGHLRVKEKTEN